mmetsp:Transcript_125939/g.188020  ORF Transcript_125939/g.188020 Transcript_125939/m.188020 type:complete len:336 (-) Transcript_125939:40-1047(-)|eukprot:CAMPEP_0117019850 /NCGR_PEP_ID=MMETSP0472-20121206/15167_1 /TAXON_ID=693140 ORGANISM="Tiarina fusus, Strain LIS" /NCGR_SAMPLE_ID=MMETSP0472 /ASSEMBLY_ACC=CAM_ASM_000603 /LENGTH=335 /DNA_ID=CAMNT_0004724905 /DNA_START=117 /DNA_END=1124 /DNA_ORIENTATION=-
MKENANATTQTNADYFFEGAEKRLEIDFLETANSSKLGMLDVTRTEWERLLASVNCLILSSSISEDCHSYVLSESSLFVYPFKILIKTCGNTTLLECLPLLIKYSDQLSLVVDFVTYSHKSFTEPDLQLRPYRTFETEIAELNKYFPGKGFTLGPMNEDRWFIYVADLSECPSDKNEAEQTIEIIMSHLDKKAMAQFYKTEESDGVSESSGITTIIPDSVIDDHMFDPCGYSMNGLYQRYYSTIHITPEPEFSYVSFETNIPEKSYDTIIRRVLGIFKPERFIISVFADASALCGESNKSYDANLPGYAREIANTCEFTGRRSVTCSHYRSLKEN